VPARHAPYRSGTGPSATTGPVATPVGEPPSGSWSARGWPPCRSAANSARDLDHPVSSCGITPSDRTRSSLMTQSSRSRPSGMSPARALDLEPARVLVVAGQDDERPRPRPPCALASRARPARPGGQGTRTRRPRGHGAAQPGQDARQQARAALLGEEAAHETRFGARGRGHLGHAVERGRQVLAPARHGGAEGGVRAEPGLGRATSSPSRRAEDVLAGERQALLLGGQGPVVRKGCPRHGPRHSRKAQEATAQPRSAWC
jgi:hypothetical protein